MNQNRSRPKNADCCISLKNDKKIRINDAGKKVVFLNEEKSEYEVVRVDGCFITEGKRCDFFLKNTGMASVFIELKGKNIEEACEQLKVTASNKKILTKKEKKNGFLVVCSRYPRFDTYIARYKEYFAVQHKSGFRVIQTDREVRLLDVVDIKDRR